MSYGIVLLFDHSTDETAMRLSQEHRRRAEDPSFVLGWETSIPHLSMIHIELGGDGIRKAEAALAEVGAAFQGGMNQLRGEFDQVKGFRNWLFWLTPRTQALDRFHAMTVERFAPLRCRDIRVSWPMDSTQKEMHRRYGYPAVMEAFNPHITLQVLRKEHSGFDGGVTRQPWTATQLALVRIGRFGSAAEVLARASLLYDSD